MIRASSFSVLLALASIACSDGEESTGTPTNDASTDTAVDANADADADVDADPDTGTDADARPDADTDADADADTDADAETDAGILCIPGEETSCYDGPANTLGNGLCVAGKRTCLPGGTSFGPCEGQVLPATETCVTFGDEDCDGESNEEGPACSCTAGQNQVCYSGPLDTLGIGACHEGQQACLPDGSGWGPCTGEQLPTTESCLNSVDDDCDGLYNEDGTGCVCTPAITEPCYTGPAGTPGVGICKAGVHYCNFQGSGWSACVTEVVPAIEDCATPLDDDCDGQVNESACKCTPGNTVGCYEGPTGTWNKGICKGGMQTCDASGFGYGPCVGQVLPATETCVTPTDEDCDGSANEEGDACVCIPDSFGECYAGPPGTKYVGICVPGFLTCSSDGTSWSDCEGEVLPGLEVCGNFDDDDCDGQTSEEGAGCVCNPSDPPLPCYTGPAGTQNVGTCKGGLNYCSYDGTGYSTGCDQQVVPVEENCATTLDENCDGSPGTSCALGLWVNHFDTTYASKVAATTSGDVFVGLSAGPTVDLGGGPLSGTNTDPVVGRYSSSGAHVWSRRFTGLGNEHLAGFALHGDQPVLVGTCASYIDFDGTQLNCDAPGDVMIAKLSSSGSTLWAFARGDAQEQTGQAVAVDPSGNVYVAGIFSSSLDFGGGAITSTTPHSVFLAKLDATGAQLWSKAFALTGTYWYTNLKSLAVTPDGGVLLVGDTNGAVDFGGGVLNPTTFNKNAFVARFTSTGQHVFSTRASNGSPTSATDVVSDNVGNAFVLVNGQDLAFGPLVAGYGGHLVKFSPAGQPMWIQSTLAVYEAIALTPTGNLMITGSHGAFADLGFGTVQSFGGTDAFLRHIDSNGTPIWARTFGGIDDDLGRDVAVDGSNRSLVVGQFVYTASFGGLSVPGLGTDTFVAQFAP